MSAQDIVARILSDANAEADEIVKNAELGAQKIVGEATAYAERVREDTAREVDERAQSLMEKRAADARLECAKILLTEKRKALDSVYALAMQRLVSLSKEDALCLYATLLECYAEDGDEIRLSQDCKYEADIASLPVIEKKHLTISSIRVPMQGGMLLTGEKSDKDLSFHALLSADKDENLATLAKELFNL